MNNTPSLLLVEDHAKTAAAIAALLDTGGFQRITCVGTLAAARATLRAGIFDAVLLDINLPDGNGVSFVEELRAAGCVLPVLMITGFTTQDRVIAALKAGADGFLYKDDLDHRVCLSIRDLLLGGMPLSPSAAQTVRSAVRGPIASGTRPALTPRQLDVLALLATGAGYAEIAQQLSVSLNTVRTHVTAIYEAMGVENRAEAVNLAWHWGLLVNRT